MGKINIKQLREDLQKALIGHSLLDDITVTGSLLFDLVTYLKEKEEE